MYVSGRANGGRRSSAVNVTDNGAANNGTGNVRGENKAASRQENEREILMIPSDYSGNALRDPEALARAEEAFRRGYVFDEPKDEELTAEEPIAEEVHNEDAKDADEETQAVNCEPTVAASVSGSVRAETCSIRKKDDDRGDGIISGLLRGITTEHIILIAAILILWDSRADDELMIMLAILLFC